MNPDVIIVGLGAAGSALAARLSEDRSVQVLALEAGADLHDPATIPATVRRPSAGRKDHVWKPDAIFGGRRLGTLLLGKGTGGGSSVNSAFAMHAFPEDFRDWQEASGTGWLGWESFLAAYRRLESDQDFQNEFHGSDGPIPIVRCRQDELLPLAKGFQEAWIASGRPWTEDLNHPEALGLGFAPQNRIGSQRVSSAVGYLLPAADRQNLKIRTNTSVRRVIVENGIAQGVEVENDEGGTEKLTAGEVILCAGAIWDPVLLLRSGIGDAETVRGLGLEVISDVPGVGRHLMDHPTVPLTFVATPQEAPTDNFVPQVQLFAAWSSGRDKVRDIMFNLMNPEDFSDVFPGLAPGTLVAGAAASLMQEDSLGSVTLPDGVDGAPRIDLNYLDQARDVERMREAVRTLRGVLRDEGVWQFVTTPMMPGDEVFEDDRKLDKFIADSVLSFYHPTSTCRAASPADDGVVDTELRVYGVDRLRVASAAIMPKITSANPNITCIAIGEIGAMIVAGAEVPAEAEAPAS